MTYFLSFAVVVPLLAAVLFTETDTAAVHVGERPPPPPAIKGNGPNLESEAQAFKEPLITYAATTERTESPPPSPTTTPEPSAPPAPSQRVYVAASVEEWRSLVASIFPAENVDAVLSIMACESGGDPNAVSPTNDHGLLQINGVNFGRFTDTFGAAANPYDPAQNLEVARQMSAGGTDFWAWSCAR